jgi:hypothetical protein
MILLIILIILFYNVFFTKECFDVVGDSSNIGTNIFNYDKKNINCCLVKKELTDTVRFSFNKLKNEQCNPSLYNQDSNTKLFTEGENNWNNNDCQVNNNLGSCRNGHSNKECVDLMKEIDCKKFNMSWYKEPCNLPIPVGINKMQQILDDNVSSLKKSNPNASIDNTTNNTNENIAPTNTMFPVIKNDPYRKEYDATKIGSVGLSY